MTITEAQLWNRLKPQFEKAGALAIRIENAANMSVPDCALIFDNRTVWVELKVAKGQWVRVPKYQYAFAVKLSQQLRTNLFWMIFWKRGSLYACPYKVLIKHGWHARDDEVLIDVMAIISEPVEDFTEWLKGETK